MRRNVFISTCFFIFACVLHSAAHIQRKMFTCLVFVQDSTPSCTKRMLTATQTPLHYDSRGLRWHLTAKGAPALGESRTVPLLRRYGAVLLSLAHAIQDSNFICCSASHDLFVNMPPTQQDMPDVIS